MGDTMEMQNTPDQGNSGAYLNNVQNVLSLLTALFAGRVLMQLLQLISGDALPLLPAFDQWQSGVVSYAALLGLQGAMLIAMAFGIFLVRRNYHFPGLGKFLGLAGAAYAGGMLVRFVIGYLQLSDMAWFDNPLPTAFHLVIAGYVLVLGGHWAEPKGSRIPASIRRVMPHIAWPLTILLGLTLCHWMVREGVSLTFATYLSVLLGTSVISALEMLIPYKRSWIPDRKTVGQDALYLVLVQVALPALLTTLALFTVAAFAGVAPTLPQEFWPHHWPVILQILLMLMLADFARYWLHRFAHRFGPLWSLHAVHHAPTQLYFLNVGRFHPLDKALQLTLDALPFTLMGVGPEVMAGYFVFYALNGFFQHSNADVKLGVLNHVIAGPELHRWHHTKDISGGACNFGNNLILWDTLFGTRYLPDGKTVGALGISNDAWPTGLARQTIAPFRISPDHADTKEVNR